MRRQTISIRIQPISSRSSRPCSAAGGGKCGGEAFQRDIEPQRGRRAQRLANRCLFVSFCGSCAFCGCFPCRVHGHRSHKRHMRVLRRTVEITSGFSRCSNAASSGRRRRESRSMRAAHPSFFLQKPTSPARAGGEPNRVKPPHFRPPTCMNNEVSWKAAEKQRCMRIDSTFRGRHEVLRVEKVGGLIHRPLTGACRRSRAPTSRCVGKLSAPGVRG